MKAPAHNPRQEHAMADTLRWATIAREALVERDAAIREAVALGCTQQQVALIAGLSQPQVSRIVSPPKRSVRARKSRSAATAGAGGGQV